MGKKHCILGGTFTYVHAGHLRLLRACRPFSKISIGLTSDAYVRRHKIYPALPYSARLLGLQRALRHLSLLSRTAISKIENEYNLADRLPADAIIVSEETVAAAGRINAKRKKRHLQPLRIISVPLAFGESLKKISCIDIYRKKTDLHGNPLRPLQMQAGTENPTKLAGASAALARIFNSHKNFRLAGHKEHSQMPAHPFDNETFIGAKNRAHAAWARAKGKCDYSLGIESGLFALGGMHLDITVCCVYDGQRETYGTGMGFAVPNAMVERIRAEGSDLSVAMHELTGIKKIGRREGAFGYFSDGVLHRGEQVEYAVACAFVPRIAEAKKGIRY